VPREPAACFDGAHDFRLAKLGVGRKTLYDGWLLEPICIVRSVEALQPPAACTVGKPHVERKPPTSGHVGPRCVKQHRTVCSSVCTRSRRGSWASTCMCYEGDVSHKLIFSLRFVFGGCSLEAFHVAPVAPHYSGSAFA
jgi:hypothetical protein